MSASGTTPSTFGDTVSSFTAFVRKELPLLNEQVAARQSCPHQLANLISRAMTPEIIRTATNPNLSAEQAMALLIPFGFCVSSVARHLSDFGIKRSPFELLPAGVEEILLNLSRLTGLPPRDSHYTTWLNNDLVAPYTFDTNRGWKFFHEAVCLTDQQNRFAISALEVICNGYVDIASEDAYEYLTTAFLCVKRIYDFQATFTKRMETNKSEFANMSPEYFMNQFRTYFLGYKVGTEEWGGTNAANVASCVAIDLRMGLKDEQYLQTIKQRYRYYSTSDCTWMDKQLAMPTIMDKFAEALGISSESLRQLTDAEVEQLGEVPTISPALRKSFGAFAELVKVSGRLTRLHFGLIDTYLVKQFAKQQAECPLGYGSSNLAVSPLQGTGGASHEDTKRIRDMRLNHPLFERLAYVLRAA